ncbi:hypothetical protein L207DRAFT_257912 [Hyaloscypha variabilis F]|uniref:Integral membrane protein TmpA n=1 Tax=Hyaloscypha variabilis (strain UAMH 11265 / GT02V1 / F) TaxID=1149755 RepID=A0A2J6S4F3_HYAVF|nr:hypothetical protein L207DRAFT_257912 [Hyaloscypha variabilis F]
MAAKDPVTLLESEAKIGHIIDHQICTPTSSNASSTTFATSKASSASSLSAIKEKSLPLLITYPLPAEKLDEKKFRLLRHVVFTVYRRLFTLVIMANIIGLVFIDYRHRDFTSYIKVISSAASGNLFVAVAMRQDYIINILCEVFAATPKSTPLRIRRILTKVFEFGGVHSSAAICSTAWFVRLAINLTMNFENGTLRDIPTLALAYVLLLLFTAIVVFAHPKLRQKTHNTFERIHRFAGWTCSVVFWTLIVLTSKALSEAPGAEHSAAYILIRLPSFWLLSLNTIHGFVPWLRLRKLEATPEPLSSHALRLHLKANIADFYTIRISDSPLSEWHSFACFVDAIPRNGSTNSVVISRAGDWTSKTIANPKPFYWTRGLPTRGVLYMSLIFKSVVLVTTGSGIGPCLNLLAMDPSTRPSVRVFWSAPNPLATFGQEIIDNVYAADPNAVIWDTKQFGRPDMPAVTWQLLKESGAEAVFVISNPKVTGLVVYAMESRGVAAYGPIFDS